MAVQMHLDGVAVKRGVTIHSDNKPTPPPPKSMSYVGNLPYSCESSEEAEQLLDEILGYLVATLRAEDFVPGVSTWFSHLHA